MAGDGEAAREERQRVARAFIRRWKETLHRRDYAGMKALFVDDGDDRLKFESPVVFRPYTHHATVHGLLRQVVEVLQGLTYHREYVEEDALGCALFFKARVQTDRGFLDVEGVDFFRLSDDGRATELKVMLRPMKPYLEVAKQMAARLSKLQLVCSARVGGLCLVKES